MSSLFWQSVGALQRVLLVIYYHACYKAASKDSFSKKRTLSGSWRVASPLSKANTHKKAPPPACLALLAFTRKQASACTAAVRAPKLSSLLARARAARGGRSSAALTALALEALRGERVAERGDNELDVGRARVVALVGFVCVCAWGSGV